MAENKDGQEKTEAASGKRLSEARSKGQVAKSIDTTSAALLLLGGIVVYSFGDMMVDSLSSFIRLLFRQAAVAPLTDVSVPQYYTELLLFIGALLIPVIGTIFLISVLAEMVQVGFTFSTKKFTDPSNMMRMFQVLPNLKNMMFSSRAAVELVHDLANPLTVMIGYASLLVQEAKRAARRDPEQAEKLRSYAEVVSRASEYCHHLADNWKQTTRKATEFTDVDLVALVREVKEVIFFNNALIQFSGLGKAMIRGSQFELTRVFQNLLKNALEAAATKVSVSFTQLGEQLEICVTDNGAGMDTDTARKALKGGFTTKTHGTGLGLGICRHLLGAHGATLTLESELKRGTTMRIVFPLART